MFRMTDETGCCAATESDLLPQMDAVTANGLSVPWALKIGEPAASSVPLRTTTYKANGRKQVNALIHWRHRRHFTNRQQIGEHNKMNKK